MSAVSDFPRNTNEQALDAGLVLMDSPEIAVSDFGLRETTLEVITNARNYPAIVPKRGTIVDQLRSGDDDTVRTLRRFKYLGIQRHSVVEKFGINSLVKLVCQGAIFDGNSKDIPGVINPASSDDPITLPYTPSSSTLATLSFKAALYLFLFPAQTFAPTIIYYAVEMDYHALDLTFEYMARDRAQRSRFLRSNYVFNPVSGFLRIDDSGTEMEVAIDRLSIVESDEASADVSVFEVRDQTTGNYAHTSLVRENLLPALQYIGTAGQFQQVPSGAHYHVTETAQIQIIA